MSEGTFPAQIKLGARAVGWIESEVTDFLEARIAASRNLTEGRAA
jgi:prophage regulatory protein